MHVPFKKEVVVLAGDKFGMSQRILKLHDCLYVVVNEAIYVKKLTIIIIYLHAIILRIITYCLN